MCVYVCMCKYIYIYMTHIHIYIVTMQHVCSLDGIDKVNTARGMCISCDLFMMFIRVLRVAALSQHWLRGFFLGKPTTILFGVKTHAF